MTIVVVRREPVDPASRMENAATSPLTRPSESAFSTPLWTAHAPPTRLHKASSSLSSPTPEHQTTKPETR